MKFSLKPHHLKRYKDVALLFLKYSSLDFATEFELESAFEAPELPARTSDSPAPEELADDLEKMGPTFVKIGRLLSSRADLLPERYLRALARLQDRVKPLVPRRSSSGQHVSHERRAGGFAGPWHGRAHHSGHAGKPAQAVARRQRGQQ